MIMLVYTQVYMSDDNVMYTVTIAVIEYNTLNIHTAPLISKIFHVLLCYFQFSVARLKEKENMSY